MNRDEERATTDDSALEPVAASDDLSQQPARDDHERRHRSAITAMLPGVVYRCSTTPEYKLEYVSAGFEQLTGYTADELLAGNIDIIDQILTEDRARLRQIVQGAIADKQPYQIDYRLRHRNGSIRWVSEFGRPIFEDGQLVALEGFSQDVTRLKEGDQQVTALRSSEARFVRFMEHLPGLAWIKDIQGRYEYANDAALHAFSRSRRTLYGKTDTDIFPPETAAEFQANDQRAIETCSGVQSIEYLVHDDGVKHCSIVSKFPIFDDAGNVVLVGGMAIDVTNQRQAEEAVRRNAEELQTLLDTLPIGVFIAHDTEGRRITGNRAGHRLLRMPDDANLSKSADGDEKPVHFKVLQNGVEVPPEQLPVQRAARGEEMRDVELTVLFDDGSIIEELVSASPLYDEDGRPRGAIASVQDATARKRAEAALRLSEARYRAIVEGHAEMICRFRPDGTVVFANAPYAQAMGTTPQEMIGSNFWQFIPEDDEKMLRDLLAQLTPDKPSFRAENRIETPQGPRWTMWTNRAMSFDDDGRAVEVQSAGIDITERKRAESLLQTSHDELEQRVAARTSELEYQRSRLQVLARQLTATEQRERKRLAAILHDDLQQYLVALKMRVAVAGRLDIGEVLKKILIDCDELCDQAIASSRNLTRELRPPVLFEAGLIPALRWLAGEMKLRHDLDVQLDVANENVDLNDDDRAMLFESVRELLLNIVKHADQREARLRVETDEQYVRVTVIDEGNGFNVAAAMSQNQRGGMGLFSITERLEPIGGHMSIHSNPGDGTRIIVELPLAKAADDSPEAPADQTIEPDMAQPAALPPALAKRTGVRTLVVDDHAIVRKGIVNLLKEDDRIIVVGEAGDGRDAIAAVERHRPEVVLMDINMPHINGIEATRTIRRQWPEIHVIGLSVQDDDATRQSMVDAGARTLVSKSDESQKLVETILSLR